MVKSALVQRVGRVGGVVVVMLFVEGAPRVTAAPVQPTAQAAASGWPGEEMPLQLAVRTPQDLAVKALAERQYLLFNLLAGGKQAYDAGNFVVAATKWEALLRLPGLDAETDQVIRPLAAYARARAGGRAPTLSSPAPKSPPSITSAVSAVSAAPAEADGSAIPAAPVVGRSSAGVTISGTVTGGGTLGPGGTVLWMKRVDGQPTPHPAPARGKIMSQRNKTFIPRVLAVPVGTKVDFRNEDDLFHNVFSLSSPNDFDTGLYKQGGSHSQTFRKAGVVQILCNIHSSMIGYVFVVDTPYYSQADASGAFAIKNVPPGQYDIETWHEASMKSSKQRVTVGSESLRGLAVKVSGDKAAPVFIPDKSGKPRQAHLGY